MNASPRSDWHREFERIIRSDARPFGKEVEIRVEEELGIDPPRIDYLILDDKKLLMSHEKAIYRNCLQHSIWEYKNPRDELNMRVISKIIGYGNFYIGMAERDGDRQREEVSLTIFRATKNSELFDAMMSDGTLIATATPGIYQVQKLTDLLFHIIVGDELAGDEHAAFRLLTDHAKPKDVEIVAGRMEKSQSPIERENGQRFFEFIESKNPGIMRKTFGGEVNMASILMDVLKPEIDERVNAAVNNTTRTNLFLYVRDGDMKIENAARIANLSVDDFRAQMDDYVANHRIETT